MPSAPEFLPGNRIALLEGGNEFFPALVEAFDSAITEIRLETYIFENDATGEQVAAALARAALRGVAAYVLVDGFGSPDFLRNYGQSLIEAGVKVLIYRPEVARFRLRRHRLRRMHRKLAAIDARIGFVGGINIIDDMDTPKQIPPRYDYAVRIEGPLLVPLHASMCRLWQIVGWASLRHLPRRLLAPPHLTVVDSPCGDVEAAFVVRNNLQHRRDIEDAYLAAIASAQNEIVLASAYFLPGRRFRQTLLDAARRGVRVIIVLQGRVEYRLLHYATQELYGMLLPAGMRIFEYRRGFLHAKVAVIDGHWATVGSSNIDPFSLLLALEANVVVENSAFATGLRSSLQATISAGAQEVKHDEWKNKPLLVRALYRLCFYAVRLMVNIAGYGGEH